MSSNTTAEPVPLHSRKAQGLKGLIRVPGDKSMSHRALMFGAVAIGETTIRGLLEAEDVINTAKAMTALGAEARRGADGVWRVQGVGVAGLRSPSGPLDFGNSGTGVRLAMGLMATTPLTATCVGDASLSKRPMGRVTVPLSMFGTVFETAEGNRLPLTLHGAKNPVPVTYTLLVSDATGAVATDQVTVTVLPTTNAEIGVLELVVGDSGLAAALRESESDVRSVTRARQVRIADALSPGAERLLDDDGVGVGLVE